MTFFKLDAIKKFFGLITKSEVVKKKNYADSIILDVFGRILLLERSNQDDFMPGKWCLPGGKIEEGEDLLVAAKRELEEETGIKLDLEYIETIEKEECNISYFIGTMNPVQPIFLTNDEHYRYQFVDLDELDDYDLILDLKDTLTSHVSFTNAKIHEHQLTPEEQPVALTFTLVHPLIKKAFDRDQVSEEDYVKFMQVYKSVNTIRKAFDQELITEEQYMDAIAKAKHYEFVKVVRDGKQFFQYRQVGTNQVDEEMETGSSFEDEKTQLKVTKYSDKSFLITGNTFKNLELLRAIKDEVGLGSWNKALGGWIYPANGKDKIMSLLAEKMDVSTYEGTVAKDNAIALKNAVEIGTQVTVGGELGEVKEVEADNGKPVYTVETKDGDQTVTETEIGIPPATVEKSEDLINSVTEENRNSVQKEIVGKEEDDAPISEAIENDNDSDDHTPVMKDVTTRSGEVVKALDFTSKVTFTDIQLISVDTILDKPKPYWIPDVNEYMLENYNKFIFDYVKLADDQFLVAVNGFNRNSMNNSARNSGNKETEYVVVSIDQLVGMTEYFKNKRKAELKRKAEEQIQEAIQKVAAWSDDEVKRYNAFGYGRLSAKQQKKYSQEAWEALSKEDKLKEMVDFKKPVYKVSTSRISVMADDRMQLSAFGMYKKFVDTEYNMPARYFKHDDPCVMEYQEVRKSLDQKAADMEMQKEDNDSTFAKGRETSYGDSGTKDDLLESHGVKVKRQNGSDITPVQIEQIKTNLDAVQVSFGSVKEMSKEFGLKISHAADKGMHAMKAIGVYFPYYKAIGVSEAGKFGFTLAHEFAHFIDNSVGTKNGRHYASDDYNSTAGLIAKNYRSMMNKKSDSKYINRTCECFARALEQYHATKHHGDDVKKYIDNEQEGEGVETYSNSPVHVHKDKFNEHIKPLIEKFLSENKHIIKSFEDELISEDVYDLIKAVDPSHGGKLVKVTKTDKTGKKQTKWVLPEDVERHQKAAKKGEMESQKKDGDELSDKEVREYAKKASEEDLQRVIKESDNPMLRKIAHDEIDRRNGEENTTEINKKKEKEAKDQQKADATKDSTASKDADDMDVPNKKPIKIKPGSKFSGKLTLLKNTEKAPNMGSTYGQDVEPAGFYCTQKETAHLDDHPNYKTFNYDFQNPLIIDTTEDKVEWKRQLSKQYKAKGKALTKKLQADGYDAIITSEGDGDTWEIIVFDSSKLNAIDVKKKDK